MNRTRTLLTVVSVIFLLQLLAGCASRYPVATSEARTVDETPMYIIGSGDSINIFVWRNPELSASTTVRPDGRITTPLVEDVQASGKTPTQLARDMEKELGTYIKNPVVTVMVGGFKGPFDQQIRVVGQAADPQALPFQDGMTVLDVMIAVGGITQYAAGNRATIVRNQDGSPQQFQVRLSDLLNTGDISANVRMLPGDILIIPEAWF
ncbi:MAG: polysaccharide export protein [Gammaproteobacteria bacterium]|nr:polysaccharide export protein [Gammaproteobacteria bacterium]